MTEHDVYEFYNERVKVAYSEIEAKNNQLPVELLFEIHSAFDHLKRFHLEEETEEESATKAYAHLKRGLLDAYKLKLKYFNDEYSKLFSKNKELKIIDSGSFLPQALKLRKSIVKTAQEARLSESKKDIDLAFNNWYSTSVLIDEFEEKYFDETKLTWAKKQSILHSVRDFVFGVFSGIVASAIFAIIMCFINS